jgi:hypothetical protein
MNVFPRFPGYSLVDSRTNPSYSGGECNKPPFLAPCRPSTCPLLPMTLVTFRPSLSGFFTQFLRIVPVLYLPFYPHPFICTCFPLCFPSSLFSPFPSSLFLRCHSRLHTILCFSSCVPLSPLEFPLVPRGSH